MGVKGCGRGGGWDAALSVGGGGDGADAATPPAGWARALMILFLFTKKIIMGKWGNENINRTFLIGVRADTNV